MPRRKHKLAVSVGVFAHNEERNIEKTLDSILKQKLELVEVKEIIVVSSGSYDRTNRIVRVMEKKHREISLLIQLERKGKSSAINEFIRKAKSQILIIVSADLRLKSDALEEITLPFMHSDVGMVGCRPIPSNISSNPIGQEIKILWNLHHLVSMRVPKCGEMVAFRNILRAIPQDAAMDEATIEVLLQLTGYKTVYAPRSVVYNKGPESLRDFVKQHRRNYTGHLWVRDRYNYKVSTVNENLLQEVILQYIKANPNDLVPLIKLVILEYVSRLLGALDYYVFGKNPYVWGMVKR